MTKYADAVAEALNRLKDVGFEHGPSFVNHAPMAAEAMAHLGYADDVPGWVDYNLSVRRYHDAPSIRWTLSEQDESGWQAALGDFSRVADWTALFTRALAEEPWTVVLRRWWPRLLPGISGALTHGVIRTAHAVRAVALASPDAELQRLELARGLGYWAARFSGPPAGTNRGEPAQPPAGRAASAPAEAVTALDRLVANSAGYYAQVRPTFPVPLIHAITAPAAVRLVCEYLPEDQYWLSYTAAKRCSDSIRGYFGGFIAAEQHKTSKNGPIASEHRETVDVVAAALELGDEHAIKLAEVAVRYEGLLPDDRYAAASQWATQQIARNPV